MLRPIQLLSLLLVSSITFAQDLNDQVLKVANAYEGGGYQWKGSTGTPKDLIFNGTKILSKSSGGTHCSGYTFMVAFDVLNESKKLDALELTTVKNLQRNWFGTTEASGETQCLMALEKLGLGKGVKMEDAKPGDFVQFWRNNKSGHSVIFLDWIKDSSGKITGIKYRSTQKLTDGIGDRMETIGSGEKDINGRRMYVVRLKG
jgi:hypothetical protein